MKDSCYSLLQQDGYTEQQVIEQGGMKGSSPWEMTSILNLQKLLRTGVPTLRVPLSGIRGLYRDIM